MTSANTLPLTMSVGRDHRLCGTYEFVIFRGEDIVCREALFRSYAAAKRAGLRAAAKLDA